jgi:hypothetical protein
LQSNAQVQVETEGWLIFRPVGGERAVGLILYPGGRVDSRAYAPPARAIAEEKIAASRPLLPAETRWGTIEGKPLMRTVRACATCGRPEESTAMTLRSVCTNALLTQTRDEANLPGEDKVRRYELALQITNEDVVDLPPKDVALIQELVGKLYTALVVGQVWEILDPKQE